MSKKSFHFILIMLFATSLLLASDESKPKSLTVITQKDSFSRSNVTWHIEGIVERIDGQNKQLTVKVINVRENQTVVRVGDATNSYSFDNTSVFTYEDGNNTVFTYGDKSSNASSLKNGDEVVLTVVDDNAVKVNATKQIEGVIELIDTKREKLKLKVDNQIKDSPFRFFRIFTMDGKHVSVLDMKEGDSVSLNLNLGFDENPSSKKQAKTKQ
jgi:hypothetical protein